MAENKKVPNPNGKKGGKLHQDKVRKVEDDIVNKGFIARLEEFFKNKDGKSRYADIVAVNKHTGEIEEIHQVGRQNKNGTPVKRERHAAKDLEKISGKKVKFHAYNISIVLLIILIGYIWFFM